MATSNYLVTNFLWSNLFYVQQKKEIYTVMEQHEAELVMTKYYILVNLKKNSVWYNFYQGTSVSITFYIFEHYQLWMMDSKAQRVFFPKTPKLCVWHTEVRNCYHFKLVSHFQLWFPIWGALVNRLSTYNEK